MVPSDRIATPPLPCSSRETSGGTVVRGAGITGASPVLTLHDAAAALDRPATHDDVLGARLLGRGLLLVADGRGLGSPGEGRTGWAHEGPYGQHQGQRGGRDAHETQGSRAEGRADGPLVVVHDVLLDRVEAHRGRGLPVRGGERVCVPEPSLQSIVHHRASFRSTPG